MMAIANQPYNYQVNDDKRSIISQMSKKSAVSYQSAKSNVSYQDPRSKRSLASVTSKSSMTNYDFKDENSSNWVWVLGILVFVGLIYFFWPISSPNSIEISNPTS